MNTSRSRKNRKPLIALALLLLIPLVAILIAVQPFFIRAVVFPRIEAATGTSIDVESFSLSPFSKLTAEKGHIRKLDGTYDLEFDSLVIRYDLIRILKGSLEVDQLRWVRPVLQVRMDAEQDPGTVSTTEAKEEQPDPRIHLRDLEIVEGRVTLLFPEARLELADIQLQIPEIRNGTRVQPHFETSLRIMRPDHPELPQVEGTISSEMDLQLSEALQPTSFTGGFHARIQHAELEGRELRIAFETDFDFQVDNQTFQIRTLSGEAELGEQQILDVRLLAPMDVDASAMPPRISDTELHVTLGPFNIRDVPFSEFLPVQSANVELRSRLQITESGQRIAASAQFAARDMEGQFQGVDLSEWDVEGTLDLNGTSERLEWKDARMMARYRGAHFLDLTTSGTTRIPFEEGDATLQFAPIPFAVVAKRFPEIPFRDGNVSGNTRVRWSPGPEVNVRLDLEGTGLVFEKDKILPSPLHLDMVAAVTLETLTLRTARFAWPASEGYGNEVTVSGSADWEDVEAVEAHLIVSGDTLDVKPWYFPLTEKEPAPTKVAASASVPEELKLPALPLKPSTLTLRVGEVRLNDLLIRDLVVEAKAERQQLQFKPVNFTLNESTFSSEAQFDWSEALAAYQLQAEMTPLNIQPIADSLLPEKTGALTGIVQGAMQMSGQGTTWANMRENLRGDLDVSLREGRVRLLDPNPDQNAGLVHTRKVVRRILTVLAQVLDVPPAQLMAPPLDQVVLRSRLEPGSIHLELFETMNTEFYLEAHGRISLAELMEASRFEGVPVVIGLNTNLAKRARIYREDRVKEGRVLLPSFLSVKGTLGEPEVDVNRSVVT
ncbi:MAG: AsmA family protein, partial [Kiritimatiellae bacterium]|nr:AsmA family protein [Kiritimatiellia bacterium]